MQTFKPQSKPHLTTVIMSTREQVERFGRLVNDALNLLDSGAARVAEKAADGNWSVNQWLKKAVLLSFRLNDMTVIANGSGQSTWWDKVPSKFEGWGENKFRDAGFRAVPNCVVRHSAHIAKKMLYSCRPL